MSTWFKIIVLLLVITSCSSIPQPTQADRHSGGPGHDPEQVIL